jgi:DNA polymerase II large subunit
MKTGRPRKQTSTTLTIDLGPYFSQLETLAQSKEITPKRLAVAVIVSHIEREGKV